MVRWDPVAGGGQQDPATTWEREDSEGLVGQWRTATEAVLTGAGEDAAGAAKMPPIAAHSGASD
jgi:hypothetical protein